MVQVKGHITLNKSNSTLHKEETKEENKYDNIHYRGFEPSKPSHFNMEDYLAMKGRIEILEKDNKEKDATINKLKAENGRLRAHKNVLEGKLKYKKTEEAKESRESAPRGEPRSQPSNQPWRMPGPAMPRGKFWSKFQPKLSIFNLDNTSAGDYMTDLDDQMMQMIIEASANEAALANSQNNEEESNLLELAIQESMKDHPNPDRMNYEQLQELGEKIGSVSKGYTEQQLARLRPKANFDNVEDCPICIDKMEIAQLVKHLPCKHVFHSECIDRCLTDTKKCPCCGEEVIL